jgi:DNA-binding GntR family transcriptional regulator
MFENLAKKTLSEQIYEKLRYDITRQIIHSDEKIDISMLKQKWNISQTPIREALMKLEQEGLVEFIPNVGARVIKMDRTAINEVFDANMIIDCGAVTLAMQSDRFDQFVDELRRHVEAHEAIAAKEPTEEYWHVAESIHDVFYDFAGNKELKKIVKQIQGKCDIFFGEYIRSAENRHHGALEHRRIFEAVKDRDSTRAVEMMREHWTNSKRRLIRWCEQR